MKPLLTLLSSRLYSRSQQQAQVSGIASGLPRQNGLAKTATAAMFGVASLSATLLVAPASANVDYFECTTGMVDAGVSEEAAIAACASARYPDNLGACVVDVSEFTGLTANSALLICQRSRRPNEVADCTINIHEAFLDSPSTKVLENCGRTLLPERYGTCVVDIVEATDVSVDTGLDQCIQAGYRPWRIQPRLE